MDPKPTDRYPSAWATDRYPSAWATDGYPSAWVPVTAPGPPDTIPRVTEAQDNAPAPAAPAASGAAFRALGLAATVAAAVFAVALAVRPIASYDTGYHLAYGDRFLDTGRIVQTHRFIYAEMRPDILADPAALGPGCRFDPDTGTYHFVNGNWLSQAVFAAVHRAAGMGGLGILQAVLIAAIFALMVAVMRRGGVGWHWIAPAVVLAALAAYERFNLRPEVVGYLILLGQVACLTGRTFGRRHAAAVVGLQVLAVNCHSYFLLGIVLAGAMFAGALGRLVWARAVTRADAAALRARVKWLGVAGGGAALASLVNPWFVRGAIMPIQTVLFLKAHGIAGAASTAGAIHPWTTIGEFHAPLAPGLMNTRPTWAFLAVMALAGAGGVVALLRRRWGAAAILAAMAVVAGQMRRNIAPGAMILVPLSMASLADGWSWLRARWAGADRWRPVRGGSILAAVAAGVLAVAWTATVVNGRFYFVERRPWRFGLGLSRTVMPADAADWLTAHRRPGRVFCDYDSSSNLMYLTRPHPEVPILTNTWAYPPYVMQWVLQITGGQRPFAPAAERLDIRTVVLRSSTASARLLAALAKDRQWAVGHLSATFAVFIRADAADGVEPITRETFDRRAYIEQVRAADPIGAFALHSASLLLVRIGWGNHAIAVAEAAVEADGEYDDALGTLGALLAMRGSDQMLLMQARLAKGQADAARAARAAGLRDWRRAEGLFNRALDLNPDHAHAQDQRRLLRRQMDDFARGIVTVPRAE